MIDPKIRAQCEEFGLDIVKMRLANAQFQGNAFLQQQVIEWIAEQELANAKERATQQANLMRWTKIGAVAAVVAALASIVAALPVFRGS